MDLQSKGLHSHQPSPLCTCLFPGQVRGKVLNQEVARFYLGIESGSCMASGSCRETPGTVDKAACGTAL